MPKNILAARHLFGLNTNSVYNKRTFQLSAHPTLFMCLPSIGVLKNLPKFNGLNYFRRNHLKPSSYSGVDMLKKERSRNKSDTIAVSGSQSACNATHLVIMVNGLFGSPRNWDVIGKFLKESLPAEQYLLHPSSVNTLTSTYEGIDTCGERLAWEVQDIVANSPSLVNISVMAHSMGGLIARFAIGKLYDPETGLIAGLKPRHFMSIATPHLGCDVEGEAQVPFLSIFHAAGGYTGLRALRSIAPGIAATFMKRTGKQFFARDGAIDGPFTAEALPNLPLIYQLAHDNPPSFYFFSALASFESRTCYSNTSGDHLVGWANSSLRLKTELPPLPKEPKRPRGVVLEDPMEAAFYMSDYEGPSSPRGVVARLEKKLTESGRAGGLHVKSGKRGQKHLHVAMRLADMRGTIIARLGSLPWRRIDVSFKGAWWGLAHNNIQVTRKLLNYEGMGVAKHIAETFQSMEMWAGKRTMDRRKELVEISTEPEPLPSPAATLPRVVISPLIDLTDSLPVGVDL